MITNSDPVRCLSIRRPWANLIVAGHKGVENRRWSTAYRGRIVIHAGKIWDQDGETALDAAGLRGFTTVGDCAGGYLGTVVLTDVHPAEGCCAPWGDPTGYHWVLRDPVVFTVPVNGAGRLGLYSSTTPELLRAVSKSCAPQVNPLVEAAADRVRKSRMRHGSPRGARGNQLALFDIPGVAE